MISLTACANSEKQDEPALTGEIKAATQYTVDANQQVYALLDFSDTTEFDNATKGLIAAPDSPARAVRPMRWT